MKNIIQNQLHQLGITTNYLGYKQATIAVELVLEDETRLCSVTREIYAVVASRCGCNTKTVERNIRTVILRTWHVNRKRLLDMAVYPLEAPPTVSEFIDIIATSVLKSCQMISR